MRVLHVAAGNLYGGVERILEDIARHGHARHAFALSFDGRLSSTLAASDAGLHTLPACRSEEALALGADPRNRIDLIIVNPKIDGCHDVLQHNRRAKVISIGGPGKLDVDGKIQRPRGKSLPPPDRYIAAVQKLLRRGSAR